MSVLVIIHHGIMVYHGSCWSSREWGAGYIISSRFFPECSAPIIWGVVLLPFYKIQIGVSIEGIILTVVALKPNQSINQSINQSCDTKDLVVEEECQSRMNVENLSVRARTIDVWSTND
jgi:hypothetical protein